MKTVCLLYGCQCNACCGRIDKALRKVVGVRQVEVNLFKATATVEHDDTCTCRDILAAIERIGYLAEVSPSPGSTEKGSGTPRSQSPSTPPSGGIGHG